MLKWRIDKISKFEKMYRAIIIEEFYRTGLTVDEYKKIIEDNGLFIR